MSVLGRSKKPISEKYRRLVHVLMNDADFLRLLKHSTGQSLSEWCRAVIKEKMDTLESTGGDSA